MMKRITSIFLLFLSFVSTACAPAPPGGPDLAGTSWVLVSLDGNTQVGATLGGQPVTLIFSNETEVGGSGGCNSFGGTYEANVSTGSIAFSELVSTLIACEDGSIMDVEASYFAALNAAETYSVGGTQLRISGGSHRLVFERH